MSNRISIIENKGSFLRRKKEKVRSLRVSENSVILNINGKIHYTLMTWFKYIYFLAFSPGKTYKQ